MLSVCMSVTLLPPALQTGDASECKDVNDTMTWSLSGYADPLCHNLCLLFPGVVSGYVCSVSACWFHRTAFRCLCMDHCSNHNAIYGLSTRVDF